MHSKFKSQVLKINDVAKPLKIMTLVLIAAKMYLPNAISLLMQTGWFLDCGSSLMC